MARRYGHHDVSNVMYPPVIPTGTPQRCEICGDYLHYQERLAGRTTCPRCDEALAIIEFCECDQPDRKRMIVPDCSAYEPFYRCQRCGRLV